MFSEEHLDAIRTMVYEQYKRDPRWKGGPTNTGYSGTRNYFNQKTGLTIEQVRQWVIKQKKARGFEIQTTANAVKTTNINISGSARFLLGIAWDPGANGFAQTDPLLLKIPDGVMSFQVNEEVIIDNVSVNFFNIAMSTNEYYSFPRLLSGQDSIEMDVSDSIQRNSSFIIYYI